MRASPVEESTTVPFAVTVWAAALKDPKKITNAESNVSIELLQNLFDISLVNYSGFPQI